MADRKKILIVDDEPDLVELLVLRLESAGFEAVSAADGQEGLDKARRNRPDLVVLDVMMPKLNGYQVCRELKKDETTKAIPIIILTAKSQESDRFWGLETGADDFISKPFEMDALFEKITTLLKK